VRIEVLFTSADHEAARLDGRLAIVIDVLRASTTIVEALAAGASDVVPVVEVSEALALAGPGVVIGGERGGLTCEGFDLGNSPREYTRETVGGRRVVLCTTNGTRAMRAAVRGAAAEVLVGAFTNLTYVIGVAAEGGRDVAILGAGVEGAFSLEDAACAGGVVAGLAYRRGDIARKSDSAVAAEVLFRSYRDDLIRLFTVATHGRHLVDLGLGNDLPVCAKLNSRALVPHLVGAGDGHHALRPHAAVPGQG
jgi:2-phosphosulfolactate phosphatase